MNLSDGYPGWIAGIVAFAAALTAIGVVWHRGVRPVVRLLALVEQCVDALPIILAIAEDFKDNQGVGLRTAINAHTLALEGIRSDLAVAASEDRAFLEKVAAVEERMASIEREVVGPDSYLHEFKHAWQNRLAAGEAMSYVVEQLSSKIKALEALAPRFAALETRVSTLEEKP